MLEYVDYRAPMIQKVMKEGQIKLKREKVTYINTKNADL